MTNFGAWAVVIALEKAEGKGLEISDYAGLGRKYPALAAAMTVFMLSLTGVPPTLGLRRQVLSLPRRHRRAVLSGWRSSAC